MIFKNEQADIGPIVATMNKIQPNIFTVTGGFIGQPGEWNVAMAAQRQADYDLNYAFNSKITNAPHQASNTNMKTASSSSNDNISNSQNQEQMPKFDSFALLAIILSVILGIISWYTYKRSKQDVKNTIDRFEIDV